MSDPFLIHAVRASLVDLLDKKIFVVLRDGKNIIGILRTFDQFSNIVLENCVQRKVIEDMYTDIRRGLMLIRGENILLLGDVDDKREKQSTLKRVSREQFEKLESSLPAQPVSALDDLD